MTSFAQGLAQGVMQGEEQAQRRSDQKRQDAMALVQMNNQAEDAAWKRGERERITNYRNELAKAHDSIYTKTVEVEEPVPSAIQGEAPTMQKVQKTISIAPGEDAATDMKFISAATSARVKFGDFNEEQMKSLYDLRDKMDKYGATQALTKFITSGGDQSSIQGMGRLLKADDGSVQVKTGTTKGGIPDVNLVFTREGKPVTVNLELYTAALGIENPYSKVADKNLQRGALQAQTNSSNASAALHNAQRDLIPAQKKLYEAKADAFSEGSTGPGAKDAKYEVNSQMVGLDGKPVKMPLGEGYYKTLLGAVRQGAGGVSNKAVSDYTANKFNELRGIAKEATDQYFANAVDKRGKTGVKPSAADYNAKEQEILGKLIAKYQTDNPDAKEIEALGTRQKAKRAAILKDDQAGE